MVRDQEATAHKQAVSTTHTLNVHARQIHTHNATVDNLAGNSYGLSNSALKKIIDAPKWLQPNDG